MRASGPNTCCIYVSSLLTKALDSIPSRLVKAHKSASAEPRVPEINSALCHLMSTSDSSKPLRSLTTLKWPYTGDDDTSYIDPLARNDPKQLRTAHYEAIGVLACP